MKMTDLPKENLDLTSMANLQQNRIKIKSANTKRTVMNTEEHGRKIETTCVCLVLLAWSTSPQMFAHGIRNARYMNLCKRYEAQGFISRIHDNTCDVLRTL